MSTPNRPSAFRRLFGSVNGSSSNDDLAGWMTSLKRRALGALKRDDEIDIETENEIEYQHKRQEMESRESSEAFDRLGKILKRHGKGSENQFSETPLDHKTKDYEADLSSIGENGVFGKNLFGGAVGKWLNDSEMTDKMEQDEQEMIETGEIEDQESHESEEEFHSLHYSQNYGTSTGKTDEDYDMSQSNEIVEILSSDVEEVSGSESESGDNSEITDDQRYSESYEEYDDDQQENSYELEDNYLQDDDHEQRNNYSRENGYELESEPLYQETHYSTELPVSSADKTDTISSLYGNSMFYDRQLDETMTNDRESDVELEETLASNENTTIDPVIQKPAASSKTQIHELAPTTTKTVADSKMTFTIHQDPFYQEVIDMQKYIPKPSVPDISSVDQVNPFESSNDDRLISYQGMAGRALMRMHGINVNFTFGSTKDETRSVEMVEMARQTETEKAGTRSQENIERAQQIGCEKAEMQSLKENEKAQYTESESVETQQKSPKSSSEVASEDAKFVERISETAEMAEKSKSLFSPVETVVDAREVAELAQNALAAFSQSSLFQGLTSQIGYKSPAPASPEWHEMSSDVDAPEDEVPDNEPIVEEPETPRSPSVAVSEYINTDEGLISSKEIDMFEFVNMDHAEDVMDEVKQDVKIESVETDESKTKMHFTNETAYKKTVDNAGPTRKRTRRSSLEADEPEKEGSERTGIKKVKHKTDNKRDGDKEKEKKKEKVNELIEENVIVRSSRRMREQGKTMEKEENRSSINSSPSSNQKSAKWSPAKSSFSKASVVEEISLPSSPSRRQSSRKHGEKEAEKQENGTATASQSDIPSTPPRMVSSVNKPNSVEEKETVDSVKTVDSVTNRRSTRSRHLNNKEQKEFEQAVSERTKSKSSTTKTRNQSKVTKSPRKSRRTNLNKK